MCRREHSDVPVSVKAPLHWFGRTTTVPIQARIEGSPLRADGTRHIVPLLPTWLLAGMLALGLLGGGVATALQLAGNDPPVVPTETTAAVAPTVEPTTPPPPTTEPPPQSTEKPAPTTTTPPPTTSNPPPEDCVPYNPNNLRFASAGPAGFQLFDGARPMLVLDTETDARNALALAQRHTSQCFFGQESTRSNQADYVIEYWRGDSGKQTKITPESCTTYDPASLRVDPVTRTGFPLMNGTKTLLMLDTEADAKNALKWAKDFRQLCVIGGATPGRSAAGSSSTTGSVWQACRPRPRPCRQPGSGCPFGQ